MAFNLDKLKISPTLTVRFKLPFSMGPDDKPATLLVKPADANVNAAYAGKLAAASAKWAPMPKELEGDALRDMNMRRAAETYYDAVIVGWENIYDTQGEASPFTEQALSDFLVALGRSGPDVAIRLVTFVERAQNFRDVSPEHVAKN